jgi:hypothetical protein
MFDLIVVLVLLALAFPVIAIVALVMVLSLRNLVARLDERVRALELGPTPRETVAARSAAGPAPAPIPETRPEPEPAPEPAPPPSAAPTEAPAPPRRYRRIYLLPSRPRRPLRQHHRGRSASRNASVPAGSFGSAASRSRSAACSLCVIPSSKASSAPAFASHWVRSLPSL